MDNKKKRTKPFGVPDVATRKRKSPHSRMLGFHVPEPIHDKVRQIADERHTTIQSVLTDALNRYFTANDIEPFERQLGRPGRPRRENRFP